MLFYFLDKNKSQQQWQIVAQLCREMGAVPNSYIHKYS